ncbi:MAG: DMT family transporter [Candidatus Dormibacteria bacterium]
MRVAGLARAMRLGRRVGFGDLLIVMATLVWSVNVVAVKVALAGSGPLTYSALRYILGGLALWALARWLEGPLPLPRGRDAGLIALAAASGVLINQASFTWSLALTNADNVAMIAGTTPLLVAGWLVWRGREHFGARVWAGLALGLAGLVLVVGAGRWSGWLGVLIALWNPLSWAVYLLLLPRLLGRFRPLTLAALVTLLGAGMLIPFGAVEAAAHPLHVTWAWLGLLAYSALGAGAITTWLYLAGVRRLGPARTVVYSYLQPFLTVLAAGLLIGEPVLPLQVLGGAIMLAGVISGRPRARPGAVAATALPGGHSSSLVRDMAAR